MHRWALRWVRRVFVACAIVAVTLLVAIAVNSQRGTPLQLWHSFVPTEPHAADLDRLDWPGYLAAEQILQDLGRPASLVQNDLEPGLPARWLLGRGNRESSWDPSVRPLPRRTR